MALPTDDPSTADVPTVSPAELRARLNSPGGWGQVANDRDHDRYATPYEATLSTPARNRKCPCGCGGPKTHVGRANGLGLMSGCELHVRRWIKDPADAWASVVSRPMKRNIVVSGEAFARLDEIVAELRAKGIRGVTRRVALDHVLGVGDSAGAPLLSSDNEDAREVPGQ